MRLGALVIADLLFFIAGIIVGRLLFGGRQ